MGPPTASTAATRRSLFKIPEEEEEPEVTDVDKTALEFRGFATTPIPSTAGLKGRSTLIKDAAVVVVVIVVANKAPASLGEDRSAVLPVFPDDLLPVVDLTSPARVEESVAEAGEDKFIAWRDNVEGDAEHFLGEESDICVLIVVDVVVDCC